MSRLLIYRDSGEILLDTENAVHISNKLALAGIGFRRWDATKNTGATQEEILNTYASDVEQVMLKHGFKSVDVISLNHNDSADSAANDDATSLNKIRNKFLSEHIHSDDEVRFFIEGQGLFCVHVNNKVYQILCTRGDFISVPANTKHWFDMGTKPEFKCIRFFSDEAGWVADYTGDSIATRFPLLDELAGTMKHPLPDLFAIEKPSMLEELDVEHKTKQLI